MHPLILIQLFAGLSLAAALSRPSAAEDRVTGQFSLARPVDPSSSARTPSTDQAAILHPDTETAISRFSRKKRPHCHGASGSPINAPQELRKGHSGEKMDDEHQSPDEKAEVRGTKADAGSETSTVRQAETHRHWRFTAIRWRDDDDNSDNRPPPSAKQPFSCFCSGGVICCQSKDELGLRKTKCDYGMCGI